MEDLKSIASTLEVASTVVFAFRPFSLREVELANPFAGDDERAVSHLDHPCLRLDSCIYTRDIRVFPYLVVSMNVRLCGCMYGLIIYSCMHTENLLLR